VHAGGSRLVTVDDPRVAADILVHQDGTRLAWLVSQAAEPVAVKPQLAAGLRLCDLDGDAVNGEVSLVPFGVRVFRLAGGQETTGGR
jgi:hypothetical protein